MDHKRTSDNRIHMQHADAAADVPDAGCAEGCRQPADAAADVPDAGCAEGCRQHADANTGVPDAGCAEGCRQPADAAADVHYADARRVLTSAWLRASVLLFAAGAGLSIAARRAAGFAEWYSRHVYPVLQGSLGRAAGALPFSAAELICGLLPILLTADYFANRRKRIKEVSKTSQDRLKVHRPSAYKPCVIAVFAVLRHAVLLASILYFLYMINCGVNYYRDPFIPPEVYRAAAAIAERNSNRAEASEDDHGALSGSSASGGADSDDASSDGEILYDFCEYTVLQLQQNSDYWQRKLISDDGNSRVEGYAEVYPGKAGLADGARDAMEKLGLEYEGLSGYYPRPKELTFLSRLFSNMGVSGIYSPFTIEANINGEMPGLNKPFTACHELSHLRGYMNEGEANYIGWLACIGSDDEAFRRSGWITAWRYAGSALRRNNPEKFAKLYKELPEDVIRELTYNHEFWIRYENRASEVQDQLNDAYLKANGQPEGVRTYDQLTSLMLVWYASR